MDGAVFIFVKGDEAKASATIEDCAVRGGMWETFETLTARWFGRCLLLPARPRARSFRPVIGRVLQLYGLMTRCHYILRAPNDAVDDLRELVVTF